jgi:hypothetical protein
MGMYVYVLQFIARVPSQLFNKAGAGRGTALQGKKE